MDTAYVREPPPPESCYKVQETLHFRYLNRENGGTLGMVPLTINPIYTFKGLLGGLKQLGYHEQKKKIRGSAALLFAHLVDRVHAFSPQVDLVRLKTSDLVIPGQEVLGS